LVSGSGRIIGLPDEFDYRVATTAPREVFNSSPALAPPTAGRLNPPMTKADADASSARR
jgi:hypothetical protein